MSFVSLSFATLYLVALLLRTATRGSRTMYVFGLLVLSWIFYAWNVPEYVVLILFSTSVDYAAARLLAATPASSQRVRRGLLAVSLAMHLGLLGYFKYAAFIIRSFAELTTGFGSSLGDSALPDLVLPIGISFYTFQSMSYTIDVYRGRIAAETSFLRLACYIAFFPHLVAGPIVRGSEFLYQLTRRRRFRLTVFGEGAYLILRGLFLKLVVADNLGEIVDAHWKSAVASEPHGTLALSLLVFFACQLFCDFAGYTDIARGLAYQLGFRLPINFNAPYLATTFTDFWRRWHITLSSWMRDYVYIPLGGNRHGYTRASINLLLVMLVSGLWHGANWTFLAWGAILGVAVFLERMLGMTRGLVVKPVVAIWYVVVQMTWILSLGMFRAENVGEGAQVIHNAIAGLAALPTAGIAIPDTKGAITIGWWFVFPVVALHVRALATEQWGVRSPSVLEKSIYGGAMLAAILTLYTVSREFIYFQF